MAVLSSPKSPTNTWSECPCGFLYKCIFVISSNDSYLILFIVLWAFLVSVLRDISERGRELEQVLAQYITFVKPAFEEFCLPVSEVCKFDAVVAQ